MFFLKQLPDRATLQGYAARFPDMDVDAVDEALRMMQRASKLIRRIDAHFAENGFSQLRFLICIVIDREPEAAGLTPKQIADRVDVSKPVMTRTLRTLREDGLVELRRHDTDRRAKLVVLTERGRALLERILPGYYRLINDFMRRGEAERG